MRTLSRHGKPSSMRAKSAPLGGYSFAPRETVFDAHQECPLRLLFRASSTPPGYRSTMRTQGSPQGAFTTPTPHFKPGRRDVTCMRAPCGAHIHTSYVHSAPRTCTANTYAPNTQQPATRWTHRSRHHVAPLPLRPVTPSLAVTHGHFVTSSWRPKSMMARLVAATLVSKINLWMVLRSASAMALHWVSPSSRMTHFDVRCLRDISALSLVRLLVFAMDG